MNEILVTGATSYIGKHCIAVLAEKGYKVRTTIRDIKKADQVKFDLEDYLGKTIDLEFHQTDLMKNRNPSLIQAFQILISKVDSKGEN